MLTLGRSQRLGSLAENTNGLLDAEVRMERGTRSATARRSLGAVLVQQQRVRSHVVWVLTTKIVGVKNDS
jgi:hypothetical protein